MGDPNPHQKALLFTGALFSKDIYFTKALHALKGILGEVIMESPLIKWDFSNHYKEEIGEPICRKFLFFKDLIEQEEISKIKLITNKIENELSVEGKRTINLDPGYLTPAKIVLASTKDYSHRIYLRDGIYAEVTLIYSKDKGKFIPHFNTYRDYQDERYLRLFMMARKMLLANVLK